MLRRTNNAVTREQYARMITLVTSSKNNDLIAITNVTKRVRARRETPTDMFEMSQVIYHKTSGSYPVMLSVKLSSTQLLNIIKVEIIP